MSGLSFKKWLEVAVAGSTMQGKAGSMGAMADPNQKMAVQQATQQAAAAMGQSGDKGTAINQYNKSIMQQMAAGKIQPKEMDDVLADNPQAGEQKMRMKKKMKKK